jgi:hypothetical protein
MFSVSMIMTDIAKRLKNASQDAEAKIKTEEDHAQGKPSSETLNKAKVKVGEVL